VIRLGRVLSQGEIDGLLRENLRDTSIIPTDDESAEIEAKTPSPTPTLAFTPPETPAVEALGGGLSGIAAFKAKLEAAKAAQATGGKES